jgi:hypothetical protein
VQDLRLHAKDEVLEANHAATFVLITLRLVKDGFAVNFILKDVPESTRLDEKDACDPLTFVVDVLTFWNGYLFSYRLR